MSHSRKVFIIGIVGVFFVLWIIAQLFSGGRLGISTRSEFDTEPLLAGRFGDVVSPSVRQEKSSPPSGAFRASMESSGGGVLTERKTVKNGWLSLLVTRIEDGVQGIHNAANRTNGFIGESRIYESSPGTRKAEVTIRVPAASFEQAMSEIKRLAVTVENETISAQDVTEQFMDLEAQLKNLRAEEQQYLLIMKRAETVEDTLKVSQHLFDVRGRIERIEGQLQFLSRQVDMSMITVSLTAEADVTVLGIKWRPLTVVKQSFWDLVQGLTGYVDRMIAWVFYLPLLAVWLVTLGVLGYVGWRIGRWGKRRFYDSARNSTGI